MEQIALQIIKIISQSAEILASVIIGLAVLKVILNYISRLHPSNMKISKEEIRVHFGSSVAVALELLLGADVLATAIAPSWNDIGKLAAIAVLRTALNYFLGKELQHMHLGTFSKPSERPSPKYSLDERKHDFSLNKMKKVYHENID